MATCYKALNKVDDAEDCYVTVSEAYPTNTDAMMELASIYEVSNRKAEALDLVNDVIALRKEKESADKESSSATATASNDPMAFFPNQPARRARKHKPVRGTRYYVGGLNARLYSGDQLLQPIALAQSA